jgi:hypothetical protein
LADRAGGFLNRSGKAKIRVGNALLRHLNAGAGMHGIQQHNKVGLLRDSFLRVILKV